MVYVFYIKKQAIRTYIHDWQILPLSRFVVSLRLASSVAMYRAQQKQNSQIYLSIWDYFETMMIASLVRMSGAGVALIVIGGVQTW